MDGFFFFGEADDGDVVEAEGVELGSGGVELAFAAVDDDEGREFFAEADEAGVAAADDFGDAGEVVLAFDGADAVAAVGGGVGFSVTEGDHGGDFVEVGDVGDVEAFHEVWGSG